MPFDVYRTTAEDLIGATDAILQKQNGADANLVADFLDIPLENATNALSMAEQLGLISQNQASEYVPSFPYAAYLVTGNLRHKAAVLRFVLEQYQPYKTFKTRLYISDSVRDAANRVRALYSMNSHREDVQSTLVSLGTYTNSLLMEGAGRYTVPDSENLDYLLVVAETIQNRELAELYIRKSIGNEAADWINQQDVFSYLVIAYQRAAFAETDPRAPIVHSGNAIESFLGQVAEHYGVNVQTVHGINAKADRIRQANHLTDKHRYMVKYLGHIRNAADHGTDTEIGQTWEISKRTAIEYVHVAQSVIADIVAYINNRFVI